jgi:hypothetical protein
MGAELHGHPGGTQPILEVRLEFWTNIDQRDSGPAIGQQQGGGHTAAGCAYHRHVLSAD